MEMLNGQNLKDGLTKILPRHEKLTVNSPNLKRFNMLKTLDSTLSSKQIRAKKFNKVGINLI